MNRTVDYYNQHSKEYFEATCSTDMSDLYDVFLPYLPAGGRILDVGCGSGRDLKYFKEHGYKAEGVDASEELCRLATEYSGCKVTCCRIEDYVTANKYDGIWCCASLLHLDDEALRHFFCRCADWLAENGILFLSVKTGITDGPDENGRWFRDFNEEKLKELVEGNQKLSLERMFFTEDKTGRHGWKWMNVVMQKRQQCRERENAAFNIIGKKSLPLQVGDELPAVFLPEKHLQLANDADLWYNQC